MKFNQKSIYIIGISLVLMTGIILLLNHYKSRPVQIDNNTAFKYDAQALKDSEQVLKDAFKYENAHNSDKLMDFYTSRYKDVDFRLDNLVSIKIIETKLLDNEKNYNSYFNYGRGRINNVERKNVIIYKVKYYVVYKDQTKEPEDSGEYEKAFILIKENNDGNWKIDDIGYPYYE